MHCKCMYQIWRIEKFRYSSDIMTNCPLIEIIIQILIGGVIKISQPRHFFHSHFASMIKVTTLVLFALMILGSCPGVSRRTRTNDGCVLLMYHISKFGGQRSSNTFTWKLGIFCCGFKFRFKKFRRIYVSMQQSILVHLIPSHTFLLLPKLRNPST